VSLVGQQATQQQQPVDTLASPEFVFSGKGLRYVLLLLTAVKLAALGKMVGCFDPSQ